MEKTKFSTIFLDMDDVLVDFDRAICQAYGLSYDQTMAQRNGEWNIVPSLGTTQEEFVDQLTTLGVDWWTQLQPLPWANELINLCDYYAEEVWIVSAPVSKVVEVGKEIWLRDFFCPTFDNYVMRTDKWALAKPGTLLVDDRPTNCSRFVENGGEAVLFPAYGNILRAYRGNLEIVAHWIEERLTWNSNSVI